MVCMFETLRVDFFSSAHALQDDNDYDNDDDGFAIDWVVESL